MSLFSRSYIPTYALPTPSLSSTSATASEEPLERVTPVPSSASAFVAEESVEPALGQLVDIGGEYSLMDEEEPVAEAREMTATASGGDRASPLASRRTSVLGKALFPPKPMHLVGSLPTSTNNKRLSLQHPAPSTLQSSSNPPPRQRKSLSPQHASSRSSALHSSTSGSLLAKPLLTQLHELKSRNAALVSQVQRLEGDKNGALHKASERIAVLEKEVAGVDGVKLECEGWEAEAVRLGLEMEREKFRIEGMERKVGELEREVEDERSKKRKFKELGVRLKLELKGRRLKEKWEIAVMDAEDRKMDAEIIMAQWDLTVEKMERGLEKIRTEELEEELQLKSTKVSQLTASRESLLASIDTIKGDLSTAKSDLAKSKKELKSEKDAHAETTKALTLAQGSLEATLEEVVEERKRADEAEEQLKSAGDEGKALEQQKKALEKEKKEKTKFENELKEFKIKLKETQAELRDALKTVSATNKKLESALKEKDKVEAAAKKQKAAASLVDVKVLASRKRKSLSHDGSDPVEQIEATMEVEDESEQEEEEEEAEEEEEEEAEPEPEPEVVKKPARARAAKKAPEPVAAPAKPTKAVAAPAPPSPALSVTSSEDLYRPVARQAREASPAAAPAKKKAAAKEVEVESKEKKAAVLADKSTNGKKKKDEVAAAPVPKKKREASVAVDEEEPAKKKKVKLFGGPKKFQWNTIENAEINGLGLPSALSPTKVAAPAKSTLGSLFGAPSRPSIFG
ncbi:hypothetical protein MNV49_002921 [Pseudohyphozyma bogoriensis]|nr:hypothetical protein MNV49_002921 [Pseudohyphozyma bogoriensis]